MRRSVFSLVVGFGMATVAAHVSQGCGSGTTTVLSPGQDATSFLTSASTTMTIEVTPVQGEDPDPGALQLLLQRANEHCNKPGGIELVIDTDVPRDAAAASTTAPRKRTLADLSAFAAAHRKIAASRGHAVLYIEYVDGVLDNPPNVLGAAFGPNQIAVFKDQLRSSFGLQEAGLEGRVLVHEMGHEFGLVNEGILMVTPHEDEAHPAHCNNPNCVMFWTLHGSLSTDQPLPADDYDANCVADLKAAGGR